MSRLHKPLINKIKEILSADSRVVAAWLEGSIARGEDDDFADIDLWVVVKDTRFTSFINDRSKFAAQLGAVLSILYPKNLESSGNEDDTDSFQIIFEDQPATLALDVEVQKQSRKVVFTKDSVAEECLVLLDIENIIKHRPFNPPAVENYVRAVFTDLTRRFWHQLPRLRALLAREDYLEALNLYMQRLEDFVTLLRLLHAPEKVDWGFKDVEYDLPEDVVKDIYDFWPPAHTKGLEHAAYKLAKRFAKESKNVGNKLRVEMQTELIDKVLSEFKG